MFYDIKKIQINTLIERRVAGYLEKIISLPKTTEGIPQGGISALASVDHQLK